MTTAQNRAARGAALLDAAAPGWWQHQDPAVWGEPDRGVLAQAARAAGWNRTPHQLCDHDAGLDHLYPSVGKGGRGEASTHDGFDTIHYDTADRALTNTVRADDEDALTAAWGVEVAARLEEE